MVDFLFGQGNAPCEYEWKGEHKVVLAMDTSNFGDNAQCIKVLYQLKIVFQGRHQFILVNIVRAICNCIFLNLSSRCKPKT